MKAKELMTPSPCCAAITDSLADVARHMRDHDCGSVPVIDHGRIVGIVTDRDLAIRALADGRSADTKVVEVMTGNPRCCGPDADVRDVEKLMADHQVRRVPVVDADDNVLGIVSQADLARAASHGARLSEREIAIVVEAISEPPQRAAQERAAQQRAPGQRAGRPRPDGGLEQPF
jgi:CBS domain-containing protein